MSIDVDDSARALGEVLTQISILMGEPCFSAFAEDAQWLRTNLSNDVIDLRTFGRAIEDARRANPLEDDATLVSRIFNLQRKIETINLNLDVEAVPRLQTLHQVVGITGTAEASARLGVLITRLVEARRAPPPRAAIERPQVTQAASGIALLGTLSAPGVAGVLVEFEHTFETARGHIGRVQTYKGLHDQLHQLYLSFFDFLDSRVEKLAPPRAATDADYDDFDRYAERIGDEVIQQSRDIASRGGLRESEVPWIGELNELCDELRRAAAEHDLWTINRLVQRLDRLIGTRSSRLNERLIAVARMLPLDGLQQALDQVIEIMPPDAVRDLEQLRASRGALTQLQRGLDRLTEAHDTWQDIDNELRDIGAMLALAPDCVAQRWPEQHERVLKLGGDATDDWVTRLMTRVPRLQLAVQSAEADPRALARAFREYRDGAGRGFFRLDKQLLAKCLELAAFDAPLKTTLSRIRRERGGGA